MQLATMLNVSFGITDLEIPWTSPRTAPRKLKAVLIPRISTPKQCLKCLRSSGFDGTD